MKTFLSQLNWRFATKKFDPEKKVPEEDLKKIMEAVRMAPTSYGLQPFHVFVLSNEELREKLKAVSYGQPQVTDASHLFIFCARNDVDYRIDQMINLLSDGNEEAKKSLSGLENMMRGSIEGKSKEELMLWAARHTFIALGFGLAACAELEIDSCPMEGFDPDAVKNELGLEDNMYPFAYMAVGYRKEGPTSPKFRYPESDLFTIK